MSAATIVLLLIVLVTILVAAASLASIAASLMRVVRNLSTANEAIAEIPRKTEPVAPIIDSLRRDLGEAQGLLESILAKPRGAAPAPGPRRGGPAPIAPPPPGPGRVIGG